MGSSDDKDTVFFCNVKLLGNNCKQSRTAAAVRRTLVARGAAAWRTPVSLLHGGIWPVAESLGLTVCYRW